MNLLEWRKNNKKTQEEIASDLGVNQSIYQKWEKGETIPRSDNMQKIVAYTKGEVTANDFYDVEVK